MGLRDMPVTKLGATPEDPLRGLGLRTKAILLYVIRHPGCNVPMLRQALGLPNDYSFTSNFTTLLGRGLIREKRVPRGNNGDYSIHLWPR